MIRHVVLMKLADPADGPEAKRRLESLVGQPGLATLDVGLDVLGTPASYDLSLLTTHGSMSDYETYRDCPAHQEFLAWMGPRLASRAVVDSEH